MKEKIRSILFASLIICIAIFNIIKPNTSFSSKENRYLQGFPTIKSKDIISGKFGVDFEKYSTDQFIGRDTWISLKTLSDLSMLKKDNTRVYFGKDHYLFDVDPPIDKEQAKKNIKSINIFLEKLKDKNIDIYALLIPTKSQVHTDKLPAYAPIVDEKEIIDSLQESLKDNIEILSLMDILKDKSDEYIYYRTDHHWTSKGAFYAYEYFLESIGETPLKEEDFIIENVSKDFLGTSYRKANYYLAKPDEIHRYNPKDGIQYDITINQSNKENSLYDNSFLNKIDKYSYFLGGDKSIIEIETSAESDKTILIIKDSFANSFIPFLTNHYKKVIVIDPRYFNMSVVDYIEGMDLDEIVFLFNIQSFIQEKALNRIFH